MLCTWAGFLEYLLKMMHILFIENFKNSSLTLKFFCCVRECVTHVCQFNHKIMVSLEKTL